jgi:hypothetical protein
MAIGKNVHIAGLWCVKLGKAGPSERFRNQIRARCHASAPRRDRSAKASTRAATRLAAMLTDDTFCSPDQAGMLLTSSTVGC